MKDVDLEEPTSFFDHVYLGCTQGECTISNDIVTNCRVMFEARISDGAKEKTTYKSSRETCCRNHIFLVPRHGRSCKEMCGQMLQTCE